MESCDSGEIAKNAILIDTDTPFDFLLCAKYSKSFAYYTVNVRLPVIVTKVIDHLSREKEAIIQEYGEASRDELKEVIGKFSKLKNEIQTNKMLTPIMSQGPDVNMWNARLEELTRLHGEQRWYSSVWLFVECYMYRKFKETFELSEALNKFDPFRHQKEAAVLDSMDSLRALAIYLRSVLKHSDMDEKELKEEFLRIIMVNLWSNSCDLSLSLGEAIETSDNLKKIIELKKFVLADDSEQIWTALHTENKSNAGVAIICDNSGYELFADLCLADFLITFSLADHVTFNLKALPWFVSDVMIHDFHWTLNTLASQSGDLQTLARKWRGYIKSGRWSVEASDFWTSPYDFTFMQEKDPDLYSRLARAKLVIFKGDLNYRKLVRETRWRPTKSFHSALGSFHPTNIATLRTIKCDTVCGLQRDQAETCAALDPLWMRKGEYAVIQFDG